MTSLRQSTGTARAARRITAALLSVTAMLGALPAWAGNDPELAAAEKAVEAMEPARTGTPQYIVALSELGRLYRSRGEPVLAALTLDKAVGRSEVVFGPDHPETAAILDNRAELARECGDLEAACAGHRRALRIRENRLGVDHQTTARSLNNLGLTLQASGDAKEAVALLGQALAINERHFGAEHRATAVSLMNLGRAQLAVADVAPAKASLSRALAIRSSTLDAKDPRLAQAQAALAAALLEQGDAAGAEETLDSAWAVLREMLGVHHAETLDALDTLVNASRILETRDAEQPGSEPRARRRRRFYLREFLGIDWRDQLLTYPLVASAGECIPGHARLDGPAGPVPVQLLDIEAWPDGSVRSARVCFSADLSPFQSDLYTLRFDEPAAPIPAEPAPSLAVERQGDRILVRGRYFGAEFDVSRGRKAGSGGSRCASPLTAMIAADGTRFGGSEFFGSNGVESVEAEVVAAGPVLAEVRWRYGCTGGLSYELRASLGERDTAVHWEMTVTGDRPNDGWRVRMSDPGDALSFVFQKKSFSAFNSSPAVRAAGELDWVRMPLVAGSPPVSLAPWYQQYFDNQQTLLLLKSRQTAQTRFVMVRDAGAWAEPRWPRRFAEGYPARLAKSMPVSVADDGAVHLTAHCGTSTGGGVRRWAIGIVRPDQIATISEMAKQSRDMPASMVLGKWLEPSICDLLDGRRLDRVKEYVLRWPRARSRPGLFVTRRQLTEARKRPAVFPGPAQAPQFPSYLSFVDHLSATNDGPWFEPWHSDAYALVAFMRGDKSAAEMRIKDRVFHHLGLLGRIDWMRDAGIVAALYDGAVNSGMFSDTEARILDAWMAYLCYVYADPNVTSIERGYNLGPPNITISYVLSLGICACAIPEHPLARAWTDQVLAKVRYWLDVELGPEGEWFEGGHYDYVALAQFVAFATAVRNAGFTDLPSDPRLKLFGETLAEFTTPPDPMRAGKRAAPPLGRRAAGGVWALPGLLSAVSDSDPDYSRRLQWAWQRTDYAYRFPDDRMGGMEMLLLNPKLPAAAPAWTSRSFPRSAVLFRDAVAMPEESYLLIPVHWNEPLAPYQVGSVAKWFAHGAPLGGAFADGDVDRHQLLCSHVVPAFRPRDGDEWKQSAYHHTKGSVKTCVTQPLADYLDVDLQTPFPAYQGNASGPMAGPDMPATMPAWPEVAREGQGPIQLRRQVLFVKALDPGDPAYVVLRDSVISDIPTMWLFWTLTRGLCESGTPPPHDDAVIRQSRPLAGDHFFGRGQCGVDLEYFIASPQDSPRNTLRWGKTHDTPPPQFTEFQDLLHLQLDGSGTYYVVLFPRLPENGAPRFEMLSREVIRISGKWGDDVVFIGDDNVQAVHDGITLNSSSGVIRRTSREHTICLPSGGRAVTSLLEVNALSPTTQSKKPQ